MTTNQNQLSEALASLLGLAPGTADYITVQCAECQAPIVLPRNIYLKRQQDGRGFHCYQGHANVFSEPENEQLKKQIKTLTVENKSQAERIEWLIGEARYSHKRIDELKDQLRSEKARVAGYKSYISKLKKKLEDQT